MKVWKSRKTEGKFWVWKKPEKDTWETERRNANEGKKRKKREGIHFMGRWTTQVKGKKWEEV